VTALSVLRLVPSPPGRIVAGEIQFKGRNLLGLSWEDIRKVRGSEISMIFQEPMTSLNPVFTIGMQVTEVILQHEPVSQEEANRRAIDILTEVGIPDAARRMTQYPHHLSGGMRQRVMIAMALALNPDLLIADEPTTALDVTIQAQILDLMLQLKGRRPGAAILLITHNLAVVAETCDRVAVMYGGKIEQVGPPSDMYGAPETPFVAEFIGTMNRLEGTVLDDVGGIDYGGTRLTIDSALGRSKGERVLVLVRPESLKVEALDGRDPAANELAGDILSHTFLGPVTRLKVVGPSADLIADVSTAHAGSLPVGSKVVAQVPTGDTRLLSLEGVEAEPIPEEAGPAEGMTAEPDPDDL
jgi:ABC-type dipeptide/oligopeptide/nickel transport system ATPase subunit